MANGTQSVTYSYDQLNRPTKYTDALGKSETYTYNSYGDMVKKVDRNGITTDYTYDALHRLTKESAAKNGTTTANSYTYALTGQLVSESNGSTAKSYKYMKETTGKISSEEYITLGGLTYTTKRLYNAADMLIDITTNRSDVSYSIYNKDYSYDSKGRLYMLINQSASEYKSDSNYNVYYSYDKNDNITQVRTNNGLTSTYSYNDANLLTSLVHKNSSTLANYSYTYTIDGNMSKKVENGNTTNYTYDGSNRLTKESVTRNGTVTNMTYAYDTAGNRNKLTVTGSQNYITSYTYDKNNRLLRESKVNNGSSYADLTIYSYDNNGNQIRKDQSKNNLNNKPVTGFYSESEIGNTGYGYEKFTYNGLNQLVKFEDEKKNTTDYTYWSDGLRLSKSVNGSKTNFMWDGDQLMLSINSDETRSYTKTAGYMRSGTNKELIGTRNDTFYLFNAHGDVTALTDKTGTVTKTYEYDAFGNEINPSANDTNPFRYCGEYFDEETGSIYLRARNYSPTTGRFTAEDPIRDGLNWYAYCDGNPVMFWDSSGLKLKVDDYQKGSSESLVTDDEVNNLNETMNWLLCTKGSAGENSRDVGYGYTAAGEVLIAPDGNITLNMFVDNCNLPGYHLLKTLIDSDETVSIKIMNEKTVKELSDSGYVYNLEKDNNTYLFPTNTVLYNSTSKTNVLTVSDYNGVRTFYDEVSISYISLGHELVHAFRDVTGQRPKKETVRYDGILPYGRKSRVGNAEEFETVGLVEWSTKAYEGRITENDLRRQLGFRLRGWYE